MSIMNKIKAKKEERENKRRMNEVYSQTARCFEDDLGDIDNCRIDFRVNKEGTECQMFIDDEIVMKTTFHKLAVMFYFIKNCIYRK